MSSSQRQKPTTTQTRNAQNSGLQVQTQQNNQRNLVSTDPLEQSPTEYVKSLKNFIIHEHHIQLNLLRILLKEDKTRHYPLLIDFPRLLDREPQIAHAFKEHSGALIPLFETAIRQCQKILMEHHHLREEMILKENTHPRFTGLSFGELNKYSIPRNTDVGLFVQLSGTVIRTSAVKTLEWEKSFQCAECGFEFQLTADIEERNAFPKTLVCPRNESGQGNCASNKFNELEGRERCRDYQEVKVQEQIGKIGVGSMPRSIIVILMDDLVDHCQAGDDIVLTGVVKRRWKPFWEDSRPDLEIIMEANYIDVLNQRAAATTLTEDLLLKFKHHWDTYRDTPLRGRDLILRSICPNLYGLYTIKLALLLALIGGVSGVDRTGMRTRGQSHLLLVGEPGTGKSQFLRYAASLSTRGVMTTGTGTTSAGLTATATKAEGGEFVLEAGALVLADGGVCCIDEFGAIKEKERTTIHEAMEQQTLSIAKAGLVTKLNTRCTVIAACNPKGKYDPNQTISLNTAIGSPLLSRFDIVLILLDEVDFEWDKRVSEFILKSELVDDLVEEEAFWDMGTLRSYIAHVKTINPEMSHDASQLLSAYYRLQRCQDTGNAARTTMRLLESLIRLSEAHARLMFRDVVTVQDAIASIMMIESSMHTSAIMGAQSAQHSHFPEDPDSEFAEKSKVLIEKLSRNTINKKTSDEMFNDETLSTILSQSSVSHSVSSTQTPPSQRSQQHANLQASSPLAASPPRLSLDWDDPESGFQIKRRKGEADKSPSLPSHSSVDLPSRFEQKSHPQNGYQSQNKHLQNQQNSFQNQQNSFQNQQNSFQNQQNSFQNQQRSFQNQQNSFQREQLQAPQCADDEESEPFAEDSLDEQSNRDLNPPQQGENRDRGGSLFLDDDEF